MSTTDMTPPLRTQDFLDLDVSLSDEERLIRDTVADFVRCELASELPGAYERGRLPTGIAPALGKLGLLGMHLDGYGCPGASAVAYGLACLELEAGDSGLRSFVSVQGSLAMGAIHRHGSEQQKHRWLPAMAAGEAIGCFGLTEPDSGSDPSGMRTTARRDRGGWVLNGTKMWITNGSIADVAVVWARTADGIRGFLVTRQNPGFSTPEIHGKLSLRASCTSELVLDDCRLDDDAILPAASGLRAPLSCLDEARYGIVWGAAGAARACFQAALEYAGTRTQFGKPIAAFQITQQKLADMLIAVNTSLMLALHLGRLKDEGRLHPQQVSFGKLHNVRAALAVARGARTVLGANGITLEYPVMRHLTNLESVLTYEGTDEIHTLVLGQAITGLPAFR